MHRYRIPSQSPKIPIEEHMNTRLQTRTRLRRGLLNIARGLWIMFALCNLMSMPFGIQAYYTQTFATGQSVPNEAVRRSCEQRDKISSGCSHNEVGDGGHVQQR